MKIIYCHSCDELFAETEMTIPGHCPICGCGAHNMLEVIDCKRGMELSDRLIENLWMIYRDYLYYGEDDETIAEDFLDFPAGTKLPVIWKWFDEAYSEGVYNLFFSDNLYEIKGWLYGNVQCAHRVLPLKKRLGIKTEMD